MIRIVGRRVSEVGQLVDQLVVVFLLVVLRVHQDSLVDLLVSFGIAVNNKTLIQPKSWFKSYEVI